VKIALVHDWMTGMGEKERVLLSFLELFPRADLFTLVYRPEKMDPLLRERRITTSFIQRLPFGQSHPSWYLPLYWGAMRSLDLTPYDLVVSLHSSCAKWISPFVGATHVCYFQSPMEGLWDQGENGSDQPPGKGGLFRGYLQGCDLKSSRGVTHFLTVTDEGKEFIRRVYGREAEVIPPTVDARFLFKMQVYFRGIYGAAIQEANLKL
jgi:hypothetical protein